MRTLVRWVRKWWPGLIPLGLLWILACWVNTASWENDLASRSAAALKDSVLDQVRIDTSGRDVTLAADAFSEEGRLSAVAIADSLAGARLVRDRTRVVPEAKPYVWSAERDLTRLTLSGSVPLPATRTRLADAIRGIAGNAEIADQTTFA